ncbi:hypothetical protein CVN56_26765 [Rhodococcus sp. AQ5-07]|nr:hypothetical protein CVN56_26765 [Rhodococcus sp. AQ5-07]
MAVPVKLHRKPSPQAAALHPNRPDPSTGSFQQTGECRLAAIRIHIETTRPAGISSPSCFVGLHVSTALPIDAL